VLLVVKVSLWAIDSQNNCLLLSNVDFGTHSHSRHLWNGGVIIMSQAKKYLSIDATNYWGYIIFAHLCAMISDFEHICTVKVSVCTTMGSKVQ
jgi:hypothetical protein